MDLTYFIIFFPSPTLLCVTGVLILYFPGNPIIFFWRVWTMEGQRANDEKKKKKKNTGYIPIPSSLLWGGASISVFCGFCPFRTCSCVCKYRQVLSVNTGPWFGLNFPFIFSLIIGIRNCFLVFEFQLLYNLCNQIKRPVVKILEVVSTILVVLNDLNWSDLLEVQSHDSLN